MANEHSQIVPSMQPTSTVADFKFWCQKVLPLVYDDSLSYYEVLNKMVVYLNQVIDNINADTANVAELEDDFLLLQTYVNNFFDDIDQLVTYTERAEAAQTAAATSAINAASSASNAATSAVNAASSSGSAATSALSALDAKDAAVAAKTAAEAALANAQTAANNAAASATAASNSATVASGSATNAAASATAAQQSFTLADAARVAAQEAAEDAEAAAELIDMDATASDVGKAIIVKTVSGDKVTAYEFGEAGSSVNGVINSIENVEIASFKDGLNKTIVEIITNVEANQEGSGTPSPDNIRNFIGHTKENIIKTGKNIIMYPYPTAGSTSAEVTYTVNENGTVSLSGTANGNSYFDLIRRTNPLKLKAGNYHISSGISTAGIEVVIGNATTNAAIADSNNIPNFTLLEDTLISAFVKVVSGTATGITISPMLQLAPVEDSNYEQYKGANLEILFPVSAGTVYGCTLKNNGTNQWTLTVDHEVAIFDGSDDENWEAFGTPTSTWTRQGWRATLPQSISERVTPIYGCLSNGAVILSNTSETGSIDDNIITCRPTVYASYLFYIFTPLSLNMTLTDLKTFLSTTPLQIYYPIETPVEYTITTSEVIEILSGRNNIWTNSGNIKLIKYYANEKTYIDEQDVIIKSLIAPVLDNMVADTALQANDFRIVNNTLYKITANIASGGTLTPGTNCTATTVSEILKTLLT